MLCSRWHVTMRTREKVTLHTFYNHVAFNVDVGNSSPAHNLSSTLTLCH